MRKKRIGKGLVQRILFAALSVLAGCTLIPSEGTAKNVIIRYFEAKNYRVIELQVGTIESISLGEKTYMGTRGFTVEVKSITLETGGDAGLPKNGTKQQFSFKNASIRMREDPGQKGGWIITAISGIPVV